MTRKKKVLCLVSLIALFGTSFLLIYLKSHAQDSFWQKDISEVHEFDDVRGKDLTRFDFSASPHLPATLWFNRETIWPAPQRMPKEFNSEGILRDAMNPGLGIRELHRQGITGKGVNVAIIDLPMYLGHPEFAGKVVAYFDTGCGSQERSMHGPSITSLLVGTNCGTAPDARVYYAATPGGSRDAMYDAKALDWVVEQNARLPAGEKIRIVSHSASPSGPRAKRTKNTSMYDEACAHAEAAGIMVLDGTRTKRGFVGPCWYDPNDPENVGKCTPGYRGPPRKAGEWAGRSECVLAPCAPRTMAEEYEKGEFSYHYCGTGGLSFSIPYAAGVLAMGWQVDPQLAPDDIKGLLFESAYVRPDGTKIINPREFIRLVKGAKREK